MELIVELDNVLLQVEMQHSVDVQVGWQVLVVINVRTNEPRETSMRPDFIF